MNKKGKSVFRAGYTAWNRINRDDSPMAMTRYIMFVFLEEFNRLHPGEYVVKGGNLLWHYIKTPRPTVDLDLTTLTKTETEIVLNDFVPMNAEGISFKMIKSAVKVYDVRVSIMIKISYETDAGQEGIFGIDCVLNTPTEVAKIKFMRQEARAATMENIICDKLNACHVFGLDNTRMKDYDDLYRIATGRDAKIDHEILADLAFARNIPLKINPDLASGLQSIWDRYMSRKDYPQVKVLPKTILEVIEIINEFLARSR